jgi:hydrogenase small subunit
LLLPKNKTIILLYQPTILPQTSPYKLQAISSHPKNIRNTMPIIQIDYLLMIVRRKSMTLQNQFAAFCASHNNRPDFGACLCRTFNTDILKRKPKPSLVWVEANACSGDSISMLNTVDPELGQVICSLLDIRYWNAIMPDQGRTALDILLQTAEQANFILAVEGAVATAGSGIYSVPFHINGHQLSSLELLQYLAPKAKFRLAVGTCAAFGGPSAARPNPSNSKGLSEVISEPVINVSGCPVNPDWVIGTLVHLLLFGPPEVDRTKRPTLFYGQTNHRHCQRRSYFEKKEFAKELGEPSCMFDLGCMGPVTGADCPYRLWNNHLNWPVKAGTPCIGCTEEGFPDHSMPFFTSLRQKSPQNNTH